MSVLQFVRRQSAVHSVAPPLRSVFRRPNAPLRPLSVLLLAVCAPFAAQVHAAPTAVEVCKLVETNQDTRNDGGRFNFGLNTNLGSFGAIDIDAFESGTNSGLQCAPSTAVPAGASSLTLSEVFPAGWLSSPGLPARPSWVFTGTGLPAAGISGSTQTATLSTADFASANGIVRIVFTNRRQRQLTVCTRVEDNGQAPASQGQTWSITIGQTSNASNVFSLIANEGQPALCSTIPYNFNGTADFTLSQNGYPASTPAAAGYPRYELRDETNALVASGPRPPTSRIGVGVGQGDLTLTVINRYAARRTVRLCEAVENSPGYTTSDGFGYKSISPINTQYLPSISNSQVVCNAYQISDEIASIPFSQFRYPANWTGNATGYPRWEMYVDDGLSTRTGTRLAAGLNLATGTAVSGGMGGFLNLDSVAAGNSDVKLVFVNAIGSYGNSASDASGNTGEFIRFCKEVEDNNNGVVETWNGTLFARGLAAWRSSPNAAEGVRVCLGGIAKHDFTTATSDMVSESFMPAQWPGDQLGYPRLQLRSPAGDAGGNGPIGSGGLVNDFGTLVPLTVGTTLRWTVSSSSNFLASINSLPRGDYSLNFVNRAAVSRSMRICTRLEDNGIAPAGESNRLGVENGAAVCETQARAIPNSTDPIEFFLQLSTTGGNAASKGVLPGYGFLEFTDDTGSCNGRVSSADIIATRPAGSSAGISAGITPQGASPGPYGTIVLMRTPPGLAETTSNDLYVAAGSAACTGNITATWVFRIAPAMTACKQVLSNGDAVVDGGIFELAMRANSAASASINESVTASEGGAAACMSHPFPVSYAQSQFGASEAMPAGYSGLTPSYPRWELRAKNRPDPGGNPLGAVIASGQNSLQMPDRPLVSAATPQAVQEYIDNGDLTVLFLNRRGLNRFMRVCTELADNGDGNVLSGTVGFAGSLGATTLPGQSVNATEGVTVDLASGRQCSAEIDITNLDPVAVSALLTQQLPATWLGQYAVSWQVYNQNAVTTAQQGTGNTANVDLLTVGTSDFDVVFSISEAAPTNGTLTVNKVIAGGVAGYVPATGFNVYAECSLPAANTRYPSSGFVSVTTVAPAVIANIPVGANCVLVEDLETRPAPPVGYRWRAPTYNVAGPIPATGTVNGTVTNPLAALQAPEVLKTGRIIDAQTSEWTVHLVNNAAANAGQALLTVVMADVLPSNLTYVDASLSCSVQSASGQTRVVDCLFDAATATISVTGDLAYTSSNDPATAPERITVVFRATLSAGDNVSNTACAANAAVSSANSDDAQCSTAEVGSPSVTVRKSSDPASGSEVSPGQTVTYTLTVAVANTQTNAAVVLTDTLSAGQTFVPGSLPAACSATGQVITCTLPAGTPVGSYPFSYQTTVDASATGAISNAVVPTGAVCPAAADCETRHPVAAVLNVVKTAIGTPQAIAGSVDEFLVRYRILVRNTGGSSGVYDLSDAPQFESDATVVTFTATLNNTVLSGVSGIGPWILVTGRPLAAGGQDEYLLDVRVRITPGSDQSNDACTGSPGNGLFNLATLSSAGNTRESSACVNTPTPSTAAQLTLEKRGSTSEAEVGDLVTYTLRIRNNSTGIALQPVVVDRLPAGFQLLGSQLAVNGATLLSLNGAPGPVLQIALDRIDPGQEVTVTYRVRVGVGALEGDGINRAQTYCVATAGGASASCSNEDRWQVRLSGGVFGSEGCVVGDIYVDSNLNSRKDHEEIGIPDVRMYFEDGTYMISDIEGKYSYCGLRPVTHVLKVDVTTLPEGSRLLTSSGRNMGDANSLFIDLKAGEMLRADFIEGSGNLDVLERVKVRRKREVEEAGKGAGHP